ncbi:MAG TPA: hypothetical protein VIG42_02595 [Solirubrobacteraceae bacterium]|jgi:hypothetical protein
MSLWHRTPGEVYHVYAEDDYPSDEHLRAGEPSRGLRAGGLAGLALLVAVTLGAGALVLLHASRPPAVKRLIVAPPASAGATRRASIEVSAPVPPSVHEPLHQEGRARAFTLPATRSLRHGGRLAGGHGESPATVTGGRLDDQFLSTQPPRLLSATRRAAGEFDFER